MGKIFYTKDLEDFIKQFTEEELFDYMKYHNITFDSSLYTNIDNHKKIVLKFSSFIFFYNRNLFNKLYHDKNIDIDIKDLLISSTYLENLDNFFTFIKNSNILYLQYIEMLKNSVIELRRLKVELSRYFYQHDEYDSFKIIMQDFVTVSNIILYNNRYFNFDILCNKDKIYFDAIYKPIKNDFTDKNCLTSIFKIMKIDDDIVEKNINIFIDIYELIDKNISKEFHDYEMIMYMFKESCNCNRYLMSLYIIYFYNNRDIQFQVCNNDYTDSHGRTTNTKFDVLVLDTIKNIIEIYNLLSDKDRFKLEKKLYRNRQIIESFKTLLQKNIIK